jgi:NADH:ubiquinone oxidoreductase subunit H
MLINSFLYIFFFYGMEQRIISLKIKTSIWSLSKFIIYITFIFLKYTVYHMCYFILYYTINYKLDFHRYDELFNWINLDLNIDLSTICNYSNSTFFLVSQKILPCFFLSIKVVIIACLFILIRAILPRYRFDQLMNLCWKKILPVSFSFFLFYISAIYNFSGLLYNLEINLLGNPFFHIYIFSLT